MNYNSDIHHRRSIRLKDYDYSQTGAYFVTICVKDRECLFGEISDGEMRVNKYGHLVQDEWMKTADIRPNVGLDYYVVMPNHFHGIIILSDTVPDTVGARRRLVQNPTAAPNPARNKNAATSNGAGTQDREKEDRATHRAKENRATHRVAPTINGGSIGAIIGQFKSITTKRINKIRNTPGVPVWQRNYYEHVIRNDNELSRIREYIVNNPVKWAEDEENPGMVKRQQTQGNGVMK